MQNNPQHIESGLCFLVLSSFSQGVFKTNLRQFKIKFRDACAAVFSLLLESVFERMHIKQSQEHLTLFRDFLVLLGFEIF